MVPQMTQKELSKFWAKVSKSDACWTWLGAPNGGGYGRFTVRGDRWYAHRLSLSIHSGGVDRNLVVDHMCHNTLCVNPSHLQAVTVKENMENLISAHKGNVSGVRGVRWDKRLKKWRASISHYGKPVQVGMFTDLKQAEKAVIEARNRSYTNNISDRISLV